MLGQEREFNFNSMRYFDELKRSMNYLAQNEKTLFIGQAVEVAGTAMSNTLKEINPNKLIDLSKHSSDTFRGLNQILLNATTFRFDGSDLMPGAIGAGSFWTGMVDYTSGQSAKEVADKIQASWDAIK